MTREKAGAADFIAENATYVSLLLAELSESAGKAGRAWVLAVDAARRGDLDRAQTLIIEADIALDVPVRLERQDARRALRLALKRLDRELPDEDPDA